VKPYYEREGSTGLREGGMMSDKDRLRRLDALFAERVMGHTIPPAHRSMTSYDGGPPVVVGESATGDYCCYYGSIPRYTRSLDAAWEGSDRHGWDVSLTTRGRLDMFTTVDVIGWESDTHGHSREVAHPAEALVLACLRAVGVEESELQ